MMSDMILVGAAVVALAALLFVRVGGALRAVRFAVMGAAGAFFAVALVTPGIAGNVGGTVVAFYRTLTGGWTESACDAQPEPCLQAREIKLQQVQSTIESAIVTLRNQVDRVTGLIEDRQTVLAQNDLLLKEGRGILQATGDQVAPVNFVGRPYPNRAALEGQLRLLFNERQSIAKVVDQARGQQETMKRRLDELLVSRGEVRSALALIPAQIELAHANGILGDVSATFTSIDATLKASERQVTGVDTMMATTEELMRASRSASATARDDSAFRAFIASSPTTAPAPPALGPAPASTTEAH